MIEPRYQSDKVTLYCADCLDVLPQLEPGSVGAVVTDPPYGTGEFLRINGVFTETHQEWDLWDLDWIKLIDKLPFAIFVPQKRISDMAKYFDRILAWCSKNPAARNGVSPLYGMQIIAARGPFPPTYLLDWFYYRSNIYTPEHPHQKPIPVIKWLIEIMSKHSTNILDPFMGSGTTGVACMQTGRRFIGIEIDEKYYQIAEKRIRAAEAQLLLGI